MCCEVRVIKVLLADDHAVVREGLKSILRNQPDIEIVGEAGNGRDAFELAVELKPDILLTDVSMPELNGIRLAESIQTSSPDTKILVLTVHEDKSYLKQLLRAGARGYILKKSAADALVFALRTVAAGGVYIDPQMAGKLVTGVVKQIDGAKGSELPLSSREEEVIRLVASGFSHKEIAAQLELSVKTVESYKARAMEKLQLSSRSDIVRYALNEGWLRDDAAGAMR